MLTSLETWDHHRYHIQLLEWFCHSFPSLSYLDRSTRTRDPVIGSTWFSSIATYERMRTRSTDSRRMRTHARTAGTRARRPMHTYTHAHSFTPTARRSHSQHNNPHTRNGFPRSPRPHHTARTRPFLPHLTEPASTPSLRKKLEMEATRWSQKPLSRDKEPGSMCICIWGHSHLLEGVSLRLVRCSWRFYPCSTSATSRADEN